MLNCLIGLLVHGTDTLAGVWCDSEYKTFVQKIYHDKGLLNIQMWVNTETFTSSILLFSIRFCLAHSSLVAFAETNWCTRWWNCWLRWPRAWFRSGTSLIGPPLPFSGKVISFINSPNIVGERSIGCGRPSGFWGGCAAPSVETGSLSSWSSCSHGRNKQKTKLLHKYLYISICGVGVCVCVCVLRWCVLCWEKYGYQVTLSRTSRADRAGRALKGGIREHFQEKGMCKLRPEGWVGAGRSWEEKWLFEAEMSHGGPEVGGEIPVTVPQPTPLWAVSWPGPLHLYKSVFPALSSASRDAVAKVGNAL